MPHYTLAAEQSIDRIDERVRLGRKMSIRNKAAGFLCEGLNRVRFAACKDVKRPGRPRNALSSGGRYGSYISKNMIRSADNVNGNACLLDDLRASP